MDAMVSEDSDYATESMSRRSVRSEEAQILDSKNLAEYNGVAIYG